MPFVVASTGSSALLFNHLTNKVTWSVKCLKNANQNFRIDLIALTNRSDKQDNKSNVLQDLLIISLANFQEFYRSCKPIKR